MARAVAQINIGSVEVLNKTMLWLILSSLTVTAYGDNSDDAVGAESSTSQVPAPGNQSAANSQTFTVKGSNEEDKGDCQARLQRYLDQQACMNPYHNAMGGIRPEAFAKCGPDVKYPIDCPMR